MRMAARGMQYCDIVMAKGFVLTDLDTCVVLCRAVKSTMSIQEIGLVRVYCTVFGATPNAAHQKRITG
ncbi:MAG: hypothetical protein ACI9SK_001909 [Zhongshania sp.]|jgi:hypothetical protein